MTVINMNCKQHQPPCAMTSIVTHFIAFLAALLLARKIATSDLKLHALKTPFPTHVFMNNVRPNNDHCTPHWCHLPPGERFGKLSERAKRTGNRRFWYRELRYHVYGLKYVMTRYKVKLTESIGGCWTYRATQSRQTAKKLPVNK